MNWIIFIKYLTFTHTKHPKESQKLGRDWRLSGVQGKNTRTNRRNKQTRRVNASSIVIPLNLFQKTLKEYNKWSVTKATSLNWRKVFLTCIWKEQLSLQFYTYNDFYTAFIINSWKCNVSRLLLLTVPSGLKRLKENAVVHILSIVVCLQGIGKKEKPQIASN